MPTHTYKTYAFIFRGEMYNNRIVANFLQSVPVKECWKLINNWRRYG